MKTALVIGWEELPKILQEVSAFLTPFNSQDTHKIELAVEEALVNIISHAYGQQKGKVELSLQEIEPRTIQVIIKDWGPAFHPKPLSPPGNVPLEKRETGGLGIFFIYRLMDRVLYEREQNANLLTLIKKV